MISKDYIDPEKKILRVLSQRYELREELGKGAHGKIYSGRDKITKQLIAVKVVSILFQNTENYFISILLFKCARWKKCRKIRASSFERFLLWKTCRSTVSQASQGYSIIPLTRINTILLWICCNRVLKIWEINKKTKSFQLNRWLWLLYKYYRDLNQYISSGMSTVTSNLQIWWLGKIAKAIWI